MIKPPLKKPARSQHCPECNHARFTVRHYLHVSTTVAYLDNGDVVRKLVSPPPLHVYDRVICDNCGCEGSWEKFTGPTKMSGVKRVDPEPDAAPDPWQGDAPFSSLTTGATNHVAIKLKFVQGASSGVPLGSLPVGQPFVYPNYGGHRTVEEQTVWVRAKWAAGTVVDQTDPKLVMLLNLGTGEIQTWLPDTPVIPVEVTGTWSYLEGKNVRVDRPSDSGGG